MPPRPRGAVRMTRTDSRSPVDEPAASLLHAIHVAGSESGMWPRVLDQFRRKLKARVVLLAHHEFHTGSHATLHASPLDGSFCEGIAAFGARIPWFLSSDEYPTGRVMTGDALVGARDIRRTDFYRGFLQPHGLLHMLCGVVDHRATGVHLLLAYRAENQRPFDARDRAELKILLEHVTLSLKNQWRLQEADDLSRALLMLSDHDANPTILVTADAVVVYRNRAAAQLLETGTDLRAEGNRVRAATATDQRMLGNAIGNLARRDFPGTSSEPVVLNIAGTQNTPSLVLVLRPAGHAYNREVGARLPLVMISVRGGQALHDPLTCVFVRRYELTAAQGRVCALVFSGQSLARASQTLKLSENTVRSHLRQIFQKTGTHGQMELVHLHARVCTAQS